MILTPKNWASFQHYKDRAPQWIKLHRALLDDFEFASLPVGSRAIAPLLWLLASEYEGGRIVASLDALSFRLRMTRGDLADSLNPLLEAGFFVSSDTGSTEPVEQVATLAQRKAKMNGFGQRYVSDAVKRSVWSRDKGMCCQCESKTDIEYDHKVPVSKGGNSEADNIQLLCRPCNRKKRTRLAEQVEQLDTEVLSGCSLEKENIEKRTREETEIDSRTIAIATRPNAIIAFERFKKAYPRRDGANPWQPAEKKFLALVKTGVDPEVMIRGAENLALEEGTRGNVGTKFIPQAVTWLNQQRFHDHAAGALKPIIPDKIPLEDAIEQYAKTGHWSRHAPVSDVSQAPADILAKHGLMPDGRRMQ